MKNTNDRPEITEDEVRAVMDARATKNKSNRPSPEQDELLISLTRDVEYHARWVSDAVGRTVTTDDAAIAWKRFFEARGDTFAKLQQASC